MQVQTQNSSAWLDLVRGTAALLVFVSHWRNLFFVDYAAIDHYRRVLSPVYALTSLGHSAVIVFFVLSGFLVGGSCVQQFASSRFSWKSYAIARCSRLYTVLIPALCLGAALDFAGSTFLSRHGLYSGMETRHVIPGPPIAHLSATVFAGNAAFLQTIAVPTLGSNGPLWSLANEGWYYALFPLCLFALSRTGNFRKRIVFGLASAGVLIFVGKEIAAYFTIWLIGAGLATLPRKNLPRWAAVAALGVVATFLFSEKAITHQSHAFAVSLAYDGALGVLFAGFLYCVLQRSAPTLPSGIAKFGRASSRISYSLYLSHLPLLVLLAALLGERTQPYGSHLIPPFACAAGCLIYCAAIYFMFERHTDSVRRLLQNISRRTRSSRPELPIAQTAERRLG